MIALQTTLEAYNSESLDLYRVLEEIGYVDNHKKQILLALWDLQVHSNDEISMLGGKQYNARIKELRVDGWDVVSLRSGLKFFFKLQTRERRWKD